jgi:hypothetical protein
MEKHRPETALVEADTRYSPTSPEYVRSMTTSLEAVALGVESTKRTKARFSKKSKRQKRVCKVVSHTSTLQNSFGKSLNITGMHALSGNLPFGVQMFRNRRKLFLGIFQVAATEAARGSGMELDMKLNNFEQPPADMEEEPRPTPSVQATRDDPEVAIRLWTLEKL